MKPTTQRRAGLRVGLFTLAGLGLLVLAAVLVGGRWFAATEPATMRFDSSVYGLQIGAPVVLRGVRVGQVTRILLAPAGPQGLEMPVTAEFDRALLAGVLGPAAPERGALMPALIRQGLVARLATQSLLTGLLYVDLDIDPARAAALEQAQAQAQTQTQTPAKAPAAATGLPAIPTERTQLQTLQAQLQALDLQQIGSDLAAVAASTRELLADPQARQALVHTAEAAQALKALAQRLDREIGPLARAADSTLAESRRTLQQLTPAAQQVAQQVAAAASQVGGAAAQVQTLAAAGTPLLADLRHTATELGRTAATLREATAEDSALRLNADRALQDLARAARSLSELGDLLGRHPDALLRGRAPAPGGP